MSFGPSSTYITFTSLGKYITFNMKITTIITGSIIKVIDTSAFSPCITISLIKSAKISPNCEVPFHIGRDVLLFLSKYCDNN